MKDGDISSDRVRLGNVSYRAVSRSRPWPMVVVVGAGEITLHDYMSMFGSVISMFSSRLQKGHESSPQSHCVVDWFGAFM